MLASTAFDLHPLWELCASVWAHVFSEKFDRRERQSQVKHATHLCSCSFVATNKFLWAKEEMSNTLKWMRRHEATLTLEPRKILQELPLILALTWLGIEI